MSEPIVLNVSFDHIRVDRVDLETFVKALGKLVNTVSEEDVETFEDLQKLVKGLASEIVALKQRLDFVEKALTIK